MSRDELPIGTRVNYLGIGGVINQSTHYPEGGWRYLIEWDTGTFSWWGHNNIVDLMEVHS